MNKSLVLFFLNVGRHRIRQTSNDGAEVDVVGHVLNVSHIGSPGEEGVQKPETDEDGDTCFLLYTNVKSTFDISIPMSKALLRTPRV